jgi:hypothetical protein
LSEETEVYLSASDEFPPVDIVLHGAQTNTVNTIEIYEDSILEDEEVFEVSMNMMDKEGIVNDGLNDGSEIVDEDKTVVVPDEFESPAESAIDKDKVVVADGTVVMDDEAVVVNEIGLLSDSTSTSSVKNSPVKEPILVSMPDGVRSVDRRYVADISFVESKSIPDLHTMKHLENLCFLNIAEYFPQTYDTLQGNKDSIDEDLIIVREEYDDCDADCSNVCPNCDNIARLVDHYQTLNFKLSDQISMKDEEHYFEVLALKREMDVLRESGEGVALLRQHLRQRDERILELTSNDVYKKEVERLEKIMELNDDKISTLERKVETLTTEISLSKENVQFYMDQYTQLKKSLKVTKADSRTDQSCSKTRAHQDLVQNPGMSTSSMPQHPPIPLINTIQLEEEIRPVPKPRPRVVASENANTGHWLRSDNSRGKVEGPNENANMGQWLRSEKSRRKIEGPAVDHFDDNCWLVSDGCKIGCISTSVIPPEHNNLPHQNIPPQNLLIPPHLPSIPSIPAITHQHIEDEVKRVVPGVLPYSQVHKPKGNMNRWLLPLNKKTSRTHRNSVSSKALPHPTRLSQTVPTQPNADTDIPSIITHPPHPSNTAKAVKVLIASSSLTKSIEYERFKNCLPLEKGSVRFQRWHGARARHIKHYIGPHVIEEKPDAVLIQAGGNDLAEFGSDINTIANDIIEIGTISKKMGASDIFIGGIPVRSRQYSSQKLQELNFVLRSLCQQQSFVFIDNTELAVQHLSDGVHLNKEGTSILANNYLDALRVYYGGWLVPS